LERRRSSVKSERRGDLDQIDSVRERWGKRREEEKNPDGKIERKLGKEE